MGRKASGLLHGHVLWAHVPAACTYEAVDLTNLLYRGPTGCKMLLQLSYDWSRGFQEYKPATMKNNIMLHSPQELEVKNRSRPARTAR